MKNKYDGLKSESQVLKKELSLWNQESLPSTKRLNDFINSGRKSLDKIGLGFIDKSTTPRSGKTTFVKTFEEVFHDKWI